MILKCFCCVAMYTCGDCVNFPHIFTSEMLKKNHGVLNAHGVANKEIILPKINPMIGYLIVNTSDSKR